MLPGSAIASELQRVHRGPVLSPVDPGYETARTSFNALIDKHPKVIARPATAEDVSAAVKFAGGEELAIAVRGGGHSVAGHSMCDDGLVVDLRLLNGVRVDVERSRAFVGGGATWRDVDTPCVNSGLVMPGGTFDTTGVAGLTLNGGIGHLMGVYGLTLDHLVSAELVLSDGDIIHVSESNHPELLWALRGGGGNFGVVVSFEFSLDALPEVFGGIVEYSASHFGEALKCYRSMMSKAPDELMMMLYAEGGLVHVTMCSVGGRATAEAASKQLLETLPVVRDRLNMTRYLQLQVMQGDTPFGLRHYWKSQFVDELTDDLIDDLADHYASRRPGSQSNVLIEPIHGQATRVPLDATAFGRRQPGFNVSVLGHWEDPGADDVEVAWVREGARRIASHVPDHGGYLNYTAPDEPQQRVRIAYGDEKFSRLLALKERVDPNNLFRFNNNIRT